MELFEKNLRKSEPLAARMRPQILDEYVGQTHILAEGRLLKRAIQADKISSLIFYGPPGTGKTTLASVIANTTKSRFETLNAVLAGVKEIREVIDCAKESLNFYQRRTILFVDEVHRWNKSQQDALLPWVENGTVIFIGATTENPFFSVNKALLSRSRIFQLKLLSDDELNQVISNALKSERGLKSFNILLHENARKHLIKVANGDARAILNALELAAVTTSEDAENVREITLAVAEESIQQKSVLYDKDGDYHFDVISAFIKSIRGSDVDAALYWMAKMIHAGEDPRYIFRRMIISAVEDIGLANPQALIFVESAANAFDRIGMPEGNFLLANAAIFLATSAKSNSAFAFFDALKTIREERDADVPNHLRDASRDKEGFGHGIGYQYPHAFKDHWVAQQYLPTSLQGKVFYNPGNLGYEKELGENLNRRREEQLAAMLSNNFADLPAELMSFSPRDKNFDLWLSRTANQTGEYFRVLREKIFANLKIQRHNLVGIFDDESGLFAWEALRLAPEGGVFLFLQNEKSLNSIREQGEKFHEDNSINLRLCELIKYEKFSEINTDVKFEFIIAKNNFSAELAPILAQNCEILLIENSREKSSKLSDSINWQNFTSLQNKVEKIENAEGSSNNSFFENAEFKLVYEENFNFPREILITKKMLDFWFSGNLKEGFFANLKSNFSEAEIIDLERIYRVQLSEKKVKINTSITLKKFRFNK